jgi:hypothetical protein
LRMPTICCSVNRDFFTRETPIGLFGPGFSTYDRGTFMGQRHPAKAAAQTPGPFRLRSRDSEN